MLLAQYRQGVRESWASDSLGPRAHHPVVSTRMSSRKRASTQPKCRGISNSCLPSEDNSKVKSSSDQSNTRKVMEMQVDNAHGLAGPPRGSQFSTDLLQERPHYEGSLDTRNNVQRYAGSSKSRSKCKDSSGLTTDMTLSLGSPDSYPLSCTSSAADEAETHLDATEHDERIEKEDFEHDEDDDMLDMDDNTVPMTAAERRAARRKMKRFRYEVPRARLYLLTSLQAHTSTNSISHERIRQAASSGRCTSRTTFQGDPRLDSKTSASLVPK